MNQDKIEKLREHYVAIKELSKDLTEKDVADCYENCWVSLPFCDLLANLLDVQRRPGLWTYKDFEVFQTLQVGLRRAESLHPVFAEGVYQGLGRVSEELGELAQSINHGEPLERIESEARDLLVVVWRFVRKDYEVCDNCNECKFPCEKCAKGGRQ